MGKKFRTFPISDRKRPLVKWSDPANLRDDDPEPGAWYGIPTGKVNGVWVLDLDVKDGKNGVRAISEMGELPDTYTVRTKGGGLHLYFTNVGGLANRVNVLEGVDVRAEGGFVVGPNSPGYSVVLDLPIADAPAWLLELVRPGQPTDRQPDAVSAIAIDPDHPDWAYRLGEAEKFLAKTPPCISGQGGQAQLWKVACTLSRTYELPIHASLALLFPYNARCVPPWNELDLRRHLERAATEGTGVTGTFPSDFLADPIMVAPKSSEVVPISPPEGGSSGEYAFDLASDLGGGSGAAGPISQLDTTVYLMRSPQWENVWRENIFLHRIVAVKPPLHLNAESTGLDSTDMANIQLWFAHNGAKVTMAQIENGIKSAASAKKFHPIRDYLATLPTCPDPEGYFRGAAGRLWGAIPERDELESEHLKRFAIAAVRRVRKPGTKVDAMLILAGSQGLNKSRFCEHLFTKAWFRDQMPPLERGTDASIAIQGFWCVEMAEMSAMTRVAENIKKEFLARCEDKYRPPYEKGTYVSPRQTVFMGTTNEDDFLRDPTGSRRYDVCEVQRALSVDFDRDAFWAAACALESAGVQHWVDAPVGGWEAATEKSSGVSRNRHELEDTWTSAVLKFASTKGYGWITASEALTYGVLVPLERQDEKQLTRVRAILRRNLGPAKTVWLDGRSQRAYRSPGAEPASPEKAPGPCESQPV